MYSWMDTHTNNKTQHVFQKLSFAYRQLYIDLNSIPLELNRLAKINSKIHLSLEK